MLILIMLAILGSTLGVNSWFWAIWWICLICKLVWGGIKLIAATQG